MGLQNKMRQIQILYFARVKEQLNYSIESIQLDDPVQCIRDLKGVLAARGGVWAELFNTDRTLRAAINHRLVDDDAVIQDQDEVAFFPPVSGG